MEPAITPMTSDDLPGAEALLDGDAAELAGLRGLLGSVAVADRGRPFEHDAVVVGSPLLPHVDNVAARPSRRRRSRRPLGVEG